MFFDESTQTAAQAASVAQTRATIDTFAELTAAIGKELLNWQKPIDKSLDTMIRLQQAADSLNKAFVGNRTRIQELASEISSASPGIIALGGEFKDVSATIEQIATGSRRNVVASTQDIKELYSVGELTGKKVGEIVESFAKVGMQYSMIGETLTKSINYVNTLGVNTKMVLSDVVNNTDKLSRFNFEGGVQGLSKMAAQASMLRFDMSETFKLAEDVLDPDRAIEVASAFQRLGVSAGNLVDPFQLMNQSINDPSGLQDSLINIGKQFTYFDEKTKTFKINPQGILTLREIGKQTGVSADKLREAALSAADFDVRLAEVNKRTLFPGATEDDKKLIANMARMGEGGEYEVQVKNDKTGLMEFQKLSQVTGDQFQQLVKTQKDGPKTIEEIQKNQLSLSESMLSNLQEINEKMAMTLVANKQTLDGTLRITKGLRETGTETAAIGLTKDRRDEIERLQKAIADSKSPDERKKNIDALAESLEKDLGTSRNKFFDKMAEIQTKDKGISLEKLSNYINSLIPGGATTTAQTAGRTTPRKKTPTPDTSGINEEWITGKSKAINQITTGQRTAEIQRTVKIEPISGDININVKTPTGFDSALFNQMLKEGGVQLRQQIFEIVKEQSVVNPGQLK